MKEVSFVKAASFGNNFVIVDETQSTQLTEPEKSRYAYQAINVTYGVGSDNFLIIQPCSLKMLREINHARHYWDQLPDTASADFIFRMFEPNGDEALCCGNGLMCIANYLYRRYGIESCRIMTEVPTAAPKTITVGTDTLHGTNWANMGHPRRMPETLLDPSARIHVDNNMDYIKNLQVKFRLHDLIPFSRKRSVNLSGHLVFTGEPHWVILSDMGLSIPELAKMIFISSYPEDSNADTAEKRVAFGSWLVNHIGNYINREHRHLFPVGININFVRIGTKEGVLECRCFERGINRETLACGTGALAVSYVVRQLKLLDMEPLIVWPHRCRWEDPDAEIQVSEEPAGWRIKGKAQLLFEGNFLLQEPRERQLVAFP